LVFRQEKEEKGRIEPGGREKPSPSKTKGEDFFSRRSHLVLREEKEEKAPVSVEKKKGGGQGGM